jgi:hypothetical protein
MKSSIRTKAYYPHLMSLVICALGLAVWKFGLMLLQVPLNMQQNALQRQLHQIQVLQALPEKWENQTRFLDITELMGLLSKTWHELLPKYGALQIEQVHSSQLKAKASRVDEQAFMQWLWAMQQQYAFKIVQLKITSSAEPTIIDVQFNLELLPTLNKM